jgi:hypothetical protein
MVKRGLSGGTGRHVPHHHVAVENPHVLVAGSQFESGATWPRRSVDRLLILTIMPDQIQVVKG